MLMLDEEQRQELWRFVFGAIENYAKNVEQARVAPLLDIEALRAFLKPFDFAQPIEPVQAARLVVEGLWQHQVHTPHPRYYGLFNPAPTTMGIAADTLVAAFNPQLAAWSHSPLASEIEWHLIRTFGSRFGYDPSETDGTFTSGGAEANHTALLTALVHAFPDFARLGVRGLASQPTLYASSQSHHSLIKAAMLCGLGREAVREIPVNEDLQMDVGQLASQIEQDRRAGFAPFLVVATAGTTNAGVIDPVAEAGQVASDERLWFHVDAAWGGAAALVEEMRPLLTGIERADSITFDAHKWLSVPMAAGLYITRHKDILSQTCRIETAYMPRDAAGLDIIDPFAHSLSWSRRFTGLKVFLSLAVAGWEGYAEAIRHQTAMGELLREELRASAWEIVNRTPLPVVCFRDERHADEGRMRNYLEAIVREVIASGEAWISTTQLDGETTVLRACITNYRTAPSDVRALRETLDGARRRLQASRATKEKTTRAMS